MHSLLQSLRPTPLLALLFVLLTSSSITDECVAQERSIATATSGYSSVMGGGGLIDPIDEVVGLSRTIGVGGVFFTSINTYRSYVGLMVQFELGFGL